MTFTGKGIVELKGAANYQGLTYVESGVLALTNGYSFAGPVKVGAHGAITVDITAANTASELAVDSKIALFSFTGDALGFDEPTDMLDTSVFLTGPVVGYTLSSETAEGRTTVYATITDVSNIDKTRKVTTYVGGTSSPRHGGRNYTGIFIHQNNTFSNGAPDNSGANDIVVFCIDGYVEILEWYHTNTDRNVENRNIGDFVVRGVTATVRYGNIGYPTLLAKHLAGNGTVRFARAGASNCIVDDTVNVELTCEGAGSATQNAWIGENNASGTQVTIVNGDVYATNGVMNIYHGVTINGDVYVGYATAPSKVENNAGNTLAMNGDLGLLEGGTLNGNNQNIAFGENASIVLDGGTVVNADNIAPWPKTVITGGVYMYGSVPGNGEYTLAGGELHVPVTKDGQGNETLDLVNVKIAEGVSPAEVIVVTDTQYNWTLNVDETTRVVTATKVAPKTDADANVWYGGAEGDLSDGKNWTSGVPVEGQILEFATDASLGSDYATLVKNSSKLIVGNGVSLTLDLSTLGDVTAGNGIALGGAFEGDASGITFTDSRAWDWTASVGQDGKLYATPKSTYQNHWIGGESGLWNSDANWEFGIPKMTECAVFTNSATATAADNGEHKMDKLVIESGKTVRFTAPTSSNWPQLNMSEFPAGGTLEIGLGGIESYDGKELALNGDITLTNDGTRDAFIKAKNGSIVSNGKLTITGESTKANILGQNNMLINGEIALDTSTENRNVRITRARVDGNITGSGYIQLDSDDGDKQCSLNGDNRGFSGRIDKINNNGCILGGPNAAGTNIEWHVTGDLHLVAENDQVWKFGALNFDWTGWNVCYITKDKSITLEVGSLGQDMTFKNAYKFWGEGANTDITVTIRKVGAGKLTTGAYNYKHLVVEAGEVALEKPTAFDNKNFKNITSVSVASGATISGYPGTQADGGMYIEALTLAPGAIVKETLVATTENDVTTYSCPVLTVTGDVNVSGVKFMLVDTNEHLTSAEKENVEKFTVLQANAVTGRPASDVIAKMATGNWGWRAFVEDGNKVVVKPATKRMVILIR